MHGEFLQDLALVMLVAAVVTVIFQRLKQPVVLGYILAGVIVGPHTTSIPLRVQDTQTVNIMSELGVILLMFGLGLHFSVRKLGRVGPSASVAAGMEIIVMAVLGYMIGRAFGWKQMDSIFLGALLAMSSTTIIVKALADLGLSRQPFADLIFGILIIEDILAMAIMALLSGIAVSGTLAIGDVALTLGKLSIFLASVLVVGLLVVPVFLRYVNGLRSNETLLIASLGLCFGVSLIAARLGYSVALGAFLIGAVIAEARERGKIEGLIESVRDMFSAVFFVAIGMLIDPTQLIKQAGPIIVITLAVIIGKVASCALGSFLTGNDPKTSLRVGMGLAQIGEFSFIIASLGLQLGKTSDFLYPVAVAVSVITTLLTPYLILYSDATADLLSRIVPRSLGGPLRVYGKWMSSRQGRSSNAQIRKLLRKWSLQIALNLALMTGILIGAVAAATRYRASLPQLPRWIGGGSALVWLAAMIVALPLLVATLRKLRAIAAVLAEMSVPRSSAGTQTLAIRAVIANTIFGVACAAVFIFVLFLGSAILPPGRGAIVMIAVVGIVAALTWRSLIKVYAKAQIALTETLTQEHEPEQPAVPPALPSALREAQLETICVSPNSTAAGKLIRELQLRSLSGASAVAIERDGSNVINPGPDEELLPGDRVLLLGSQTQLDAARHFFVA
jgi:CPA2 family monovalent cation:H+ antiporter-2